MEEPMLTASDVAEQLSVSVYTIRNYVNKEDWDSIPQPKAKIGKSWRWLYSDVIAFKRGFKSEHKTADKKKLPNEWAKYC